VNWSIIPRAEILGNQWDALVRGSPDGWVFGLYSWQEIILSVERWSLQDHSFGVCCGEKLVAVMPLQLNSSSGILSSSGWGGVGPMVSAEVDPPTRAKVLGFALDHGMALARELGAGGLEIACSPVTETSLRSHWGVNRLVFFGFEDESGLCQVIDLRPAEEVLWKNLKADARNQIRRAQKAGVRVEAADWSSDLDHYYDLHCETYQRTGVPPHPKAYFSGISEHLGPANGSILWKAVGPDDEVLAFHNSAVFNQGAVYHTGCSSEKAATNGANYLVFWEAIIGAKKRGIDWYDCGAIYPTSRDKKQAGLTTFKTKFGGEAHRLFRSKIQFEFVAPGNAGKKHPAPFGSTGRRLIARAKQCLKGRLKRFAAVSGPPEAEVRPRQWNQ